MRTAIVSFLVGVTLGAVGLWFVQQHPEIVGLSRPTSSAAGTPASMDGAADSALTALHLRSEDIEQELARTGQIVRRSVVDWASELAGAAEDARVTTAVKARLVTDRELAGTAIAVTTTNGSVTLAGTVGSTELIGRAVALAMGTRGVREVRSTLNVA